MLWVKITFTLKSRELMMIMFGWGCESTPWLKVGWSPCVHLTPPDFLLCSSKDKSHNYYNHQRASSLQRILCSTAAMFCWFIDLFRWEQSSNLSQFEDVTLGSRNFTDIQQPPYFLKLNYIKVITEVSAHFLRCQDKQLHAEVKCVVMFRHLCVLLFRYLCKCFLIIQ